MAKVREYMPAKIDREVERLDRGVGRRVATREEPAPTPDARVRRARNFGLSQVWARRVRRKVVSIIELKHLIPGPLNEEHLQSYAPGVWRVLDKTRGKRGTKRPTLLDAVLQALRTDVFNVAAPIPQGPASTTAGGSCRQARSQPPGWCSGSVRALRHACMRDT